MNIYIDNSEVKRFTNKLREMHRSNLPIVVRQTLNDAAFDVMKNTLPVKFKDEFTIRNKSFLRAHSGVEKADGWDVNSMRSKVGINPKGSKAAENLTKQEYGGSVKRPFMYMNAARIGNSLTKLVRKQNYINKMGFVKGNPSVSRRTRISNFVAAAVMGMRLNKLVLWESKNGDTAFLIKGISFTGTGINRKVKVNSTPIAEYQRGFNKSLKPHYFLQKASLESGQKLNVFFIDNAKKRFEKALK